MKFVFQRVGSQLFVEAVLLKRVPCCRLFIGVKKCVRFGVERSALSWISKAFLSIWYSDEITASGTDGLEFLFAMGWHRSFQTLTESSK